MVSGQETMWSNSLRLNPLQHEEIRKPMIGVEFAKMDFSLGEPLLVNLTDSWPDEALFSSGVAEQCSSHNDSVMQFLKSRWSELEMGGLRSSMGHQTLQLTVDLEPYNNPLVDVVGDMVRSSKITIHRDGRVILTATGAEIKDIVPIVAEFYLENSSSSWRKQSAAVIPHFSWFDTYGSDFASSNVQNMTVAPLISPQKVKINQSVKKNRNRRGSADRDLHKRNYFHGCESLLSLMMNKKHNGKRAILSLKKSGPELPELLTQCSAGIAGTGIAILFTVACKLASGTVPFCISKLLNIGLGVVMVWLSSAVNKLRDAVVHVGRNASKGLGDEAVMSIVDGSLKDVYFRAATLLAVAVLRVA
ncbi:hypothetical protein LINPERHAP1_LOCUS9691 [Linum perenne]